MPRSDCKSCTKKHHFDVPWAIKLRASFTTIFDAWLIALVKDIMGYSVKLTLKHLDLSANAFRDESEGFVGINNGWPAIISNLKSMLETG